MGDLPLPSNTYIPVSGTFHTRLSYLTVVQVVK